MDSPAVRVPGLPGGARDDSARALAALSAISGYEPEQALREGIDLNLPVIRHPKTKSEESTLERTDPNAAKRANMTEKLSGTDALKDPLKRTMAGLDKPVVDIAKTDRKGSNTL